jgi:TolB-like protein
MDDWILEEREGRLRRAGRSVLLTPRAAQVLGFLARHPGVVFSREEIVSAVWGGINVKSDIVREYIFDIRAALGEYSNEEHYVETVRGRGYRLSGGISLAPDPLRDAVRPPVIAALRPAVFSGAPHWRHLADALVDDVRTDLARFPDIEVIARQSSFSVLPGADSRGVAEDLGADYLIEGAITPGDSLRCSFRLIDGKTGRSVWTERYESAIADLPGLSEWLAAKVANAIGGWRGAVQSAELRRIRRKRATSLTAYENYLICCHHEHGRDAESVRLGIVHGETATRLDPDFARTWLLLWFLHHRSAHHLGASDAALGRAVEAIETAYRLDPRDPMILSEVAVSRAIGGEREEAVILLTRAADLGANHADALALLSLSHAVIAGDLTEARRLIRQARRLDPMNLDLVPSVECRLRFYERDFEGSLQIARQMAGYQPAELYAALSTAMLNGSDNIRGARARFLSAYPGFDFAAHCRGFPIVAPCALSLFEEAARRLVSE